MKTADELRAYLRDLEGAEDHITPETCFGGDGGPHVSLAFTNIGGLLGPHARVCRLCGSIFVNGDEIAKFLKHERRRAQDELQRIEDLSKPTRRGALREAQRALPPSRPRKARARTAR